MRASGLHDPFDDIAGGITLTERVPGESKKGLTSGGISCSEISDFGERDAHRIPQLDVTGLFSRLFVSKVEADVIASGKRRCTRHRQDCVTNSTSLNLPYSLFAGRVTVHLRLRRTDSGNINSQLLAVPPKERPFPSAAPEGPRDRASHASGPTKVMNDQ